MTLTLKDPTMNSNMLRQLNNKRGLTLVELMIVVAIIGILASVGGVAYFRNIRTANITKAKNRAMELSKAQNEFFQKVSGEEDASYFPPPDATALGNPSCVQFGGSGRPGNWPTYNVWINTFNNNTKPDPQDSTKVYDTLSLSSQYRICLTSGQAGESCDSFAADTCAAFNGQLNEDARWFIIEIIVDFDDTSGTDTIIALHNESDEPLVLNEGN